MKTKQKFSNEYLKKCSSMTKSQVLDFLENFRELHTRTNDPTKLISIRVKESLLESFKNKANVTGIPYQTQIKKLMNNWLKQS